MKPLSIYKEMDGVKPSPISLAVCEGREAAFFFILNGEYIMIDPNDLLQRNLYGPGKSRANV